MNPLSETNPIYPYHPAYGLPDDYRTKAVLMSIQYGIKKASERCNVGVSTIYKWRADMGLNKKRNNNA